MGHVALDCVYCCVKVVNISIKIIRLVAESTSPATNFLLAKSYFLVQRQLFRGVLFRKKNFSPPYYEKTSSVIESKQPSYMSAI